MGLEVIARPLFWIEPLSWEAPDPAAYDGLLLTSANAVRHGGPRMGLLRNLPVHAVGKATAAVAREAGFTVASIGSSDAATLLDGLPAGLRLLHLSGEEVRLPSDPRIERRIVYRSVEIEHPALPDLEGLVAGVHSLRAARRFAELTSRRDRTAIAAISEAAAEAAGSGWECVEVAKRPDDASLLALAAMLCHISPPK